MRVTLTGGTGFLGGHIVRALVDEGHEPHLLVRSASKLDELIELFALPAHIGCTVGDILDAHSVARSMAGADACIHAAAFTTLDPGEMDRCLTINGPGTKIVLDAAVDAGCDPIIHMSSTSCIFPPSGDIQDPAVDEVRSSDAPYSRSKAESDLYARGLQADGRPVTILYPTGLLGPYDLGQNVLATYLVNLLSSDVLISGPSGGWALLDVRDVARATVGLLRAGLGPRRFLAQGEIASFGEFNALLDDVSGRERAVVSMSREQLLEAMDPEAVDIMLNLRPGRYRPLLEETGVAWRPLRETMLDTVGWLVGRGQLDAAWAPAVASGQ